MSRLAVGLAADEIGPGQMGRLMVTTDAVEAARRRPAVASGLWL